MVTSREPVAKTTLWGKRNCYRVKLQHLLFSKMYSKQTRNKNRTKLLYCCFGTLHFRERFISMPTFLWVHIAKNFSILYWLAISCDRSDWLPQDIGGIPIHLFCDIIHVHPRWRAHPRAHVILDRALLHSWCMQKFEIFTRKSDPEFFASF